jgi:hypothetical protein
MKLTSRSILVSMLCAAAVTAQFVAGKATRDALFLTSLGFHALPMMLIAASVCSILLVATHARIAAKIAPTTLIQILSAVSGVLFLCEWAVRFHAPAATATLLFLHTSAMGPLLTSGFWLIATERFEPRTAKRRFGQITGAGTVGGLLGALLSERVAATLGAPAMLLVLGSLQLLTVGLFSRLAAATQRFAERQHLSPAPHASKARSGLRVIAEAPHLRQLVALVLLGSTSATLLDYLFKVKAVEAMDFEFFICSHGALGKKADVTANIRYREELKAAVTKALGAGQTLEQAQKSVMMEAYKDWDFYEQQRPQNVAGMYRALTAKK